ncbi:hypothetical protein F2Q69_00027480 [Brassica cretica]|uniref:Dehydrogenase E1 component domain-containing protein n=1 Tax=Brassica cretica TaxID=69181 RepID=A0A8S9S148_BRACR|nr:hypothetical protein F2Q69_00027480 [Brassica cretica]
MLLCITILHLPTKSFNLLTPKKETFQTKSENGVITTLSPIHHRFTSLPPPLRFDRPNLDHNRNGRPFHRPPMRRSLTLRGDLIPGDPLLLPRMEIAADSLYKSKLIRGFCHLYDGQEALAVGMEAAITKKDAIITSYRDHCTFLGRGGELVDAFSELMGRMRGCSSGKGGSMHFYKKDASFYGGHGIVGAQIPLGCCLAFAQKYSKEENFESLIEFDDVDGMGTATWRSAKSPAYFKRGDYVPGLKVDGMDVLAVKQACKFAKEHALKNGPILSLLNPQSSFLFILEMDTYRYHGHSMSDPGSTYRTRDEVSGVRQVRDPIERVRKLLLSHDIATEKELKDIEKEVRKEVDDAVAQAKESPVPEPSELFTNMYMKDCGVESFGADRKELKVTLA